MKFDPVAATILLEASAVGIALYVVHYKQRPTPFRTLAAGGGLFVFGLACSLLAPLFVPDSQAQTVTYVTNFALLVSGIGGSLIAAAAVMTSTESANKASPVQATSTAAVIEEPTFRIAAALDANPLTQHSRSARPNGPIIATIGFCAVSMLLIALRSRR